MLIGAPRVHAGPLRLRAQLRRPPRAARGPGPRPQRREPRARRVLHALHLLRPRGDAGAGDGPRRAPGAAAWPAPCSSIPEGFGRDLAAGRMARRSSSSSTARTPRPRPDRPRLRPRPRVRAERRARGRGARPRRAAARPAPRPRAARPLQPGARVDPVPGPRPHRLPADAHRRPLHRALRRAREGAGDHGAAARRPAADLGADPRQDVPLPRHLAPRDPHHPRSPRACSSGSRSAALTSTCCVAVLLYLFGALGFGLLISTIADTRPSPSRPGSSPPCCPPSSSPASSSRSASCPRGSRSSPTSCPPRYFLVDPARHHPQGRGLATYWPQVGALVALRPRHGDARLGCGSRGGRPERCTSSGA